MWGKNLLSENQQSRPFLRCIAVVYCSGVRVPGNIAIFLKIGSVPDLLAAINHTSISTRNLAVKMIQREGHWLFS